MSRMHQLPALIVIAKEPRPGRSKTRLTPPCSPEQAARLAEAALGDTLAAVADAHASRRVLVLEGRAGPWVPPDFEVVPQAAGGLDLRLAAAFEVVGGPALLVGMDTPQLTPALINAGTAALMDGEADAVLGLAPDGGYWAVGLREPREGLFEGVPMSTRFTGDAQRRRLESAGFEVAMLPELRDVDTFDGAIEVARDCPGSRFERVLGEVRAEEASAASPVAAAASR